MHPRIAELIGFLDEHHEQLRATYAAIPEERRAVRPAEDRWSPTDIIGHLTIIEWRLAGLMTAKLDLAHAAGLAAETDDSPILPTIDLTPLLDRGQKIVAPEPTRPNNLPQPATWDDYERARAQFKAALLAGDGLALRTITHPHPVFGQVDMYTWAAFAGAHATRHAEQMREAVASAPA